MLSEHHAQLLRVIDVDNTDPLDFYGDTSALEVDTLKFESVGIDEVRRITKVACLKPEVAKYRLLVIVSPVITFEAQQALLKILEEPPQSTKFLFVVPVDLDILPTLASRFQVLENFVAETANKVFSEFSLLSYGERLAEVTKRMTKKDMVWAMEIRRGLVDYLRHESKTLPIIKLNTLSLIMEKLGVRGSSNKMLLEELALTL